MPWLPQYPETQWRDVPMPSGAGLGAEALRLIAQRRQQQFQQGQNAATQVAAAIRQRQLDQIANRMMWQQQNPEDAQLGQEPAGGYPNQGGYNAWQMQLQQQRWDPYRQLMSKGYFYDENTGQLVRAGTPGLQEERQARERYWQGMLGNQQQRIAAQQAVQNQKIATDLLNNLGIKLTDLAP